jgi:hypothetical protein
MEDLSFDVYIHDLEVPTHKLRAGSNIRLTMTNSNGLMNLALKANKENESTYTAFIKDSLSIGFSSSEDFILENEISNLVLSMNLFLLRSCVTNQGTEIKPQQVSISGIHDSLSFVKTITDSFDENEVIETFRRLNRFNRFETKVAKTDINLILSLKHYEQAMRDSEPLFVFRNLFNSFQDIVDVQGINLSGPTFDAECSKLTGLSASEIENWREFYNRIKHIQLNENHIERFTKGSENILTMTSGLRKVTQQLLLIKLNQTG